MNNTALKTRFGETESIDLVKAEVKSATALEGSMQSIAEDTALIGSESALDSMKLVELCLSLEDRAAEFGFEFDWTSEAAMSKSRSMFRTIASLAEEFLRQYDEMT